jgi:Uma2 family endonuclease
MGKPAPLQPPRYPATERDLWDLPEDVIGQIIDGELIVHPRPEPPHVQAASGLGVLLSVPFRYGFGGGPGGWIILDEPKIRFGKDLLVIDPDLRTLEGLKLQEGRWLIVGVFREDGKVRAEPFEAFELDLSLLWEDVPAVEDEGEP